MSLKARLYYSILLIALIGCDGSPQNSSTGGVEEVGIDLPATNLAAAEPALNNDLRLPDVLPVIVQVMPLRMDAEKPSPGPVKVSVYGSDLQDVVALVFGPSPFRVALQDVPANPDDVQRRRVFDVPSAIIKQSEWLRAESAAGLPSEPFYFREVTGRHPDLVRTNRNILPGHESDPLLVLGHNFFEHTSILLLDGSALAASRYRLEQGSNGAFRLTLANLESGVHTLQLRNPPHDPQDDLDQQRPYQSADSNILSIAVVDAEQADILISNDAVSLRIDGLSGTLRQLSDLGSGHRYRLVGQYPWRLVVRALRDPLALTDANNPVLGGPYINPINAGCYQNLTAETLGDSLRLVWRDCELPTLSGAINRFTVEQTFTLQASSTELRFRTVVRRDARHPVRDYGLVEVKSYVSIHDGADIQSARWDAPLDGNAAESFGTASGRQMETYRNPGRAMPSIGGRDTCPGNPAVPELRCVAGATRDGWMNHDGDGFSWYSASYPTSAYYDIEGHWLAVFPNDDALTPTSVVHQGDLGEFRSTLGDVIGSSFVAASFDHVAPLEWIVSFGRGTAYVGEETWINVADRVRVHYESFGLLDTPLSSRDEIPGALAQLTAHSIYGGDTEFANAQHQPVAPDPKLLSAFSRSFRQYGIEADESFVFFWGGMVDQSQGFMRLRPNPKSMPLSEMLSDLGVASCHYSGYSLLEAYDPLYSGNARIEAIRTDPAGNVAEWTEHDGRGVLAMHPRSQGQMSWRLNRFDDMLGDDRKGPRCVYLDGVYVASAYNAAYGSNGTDRQAVLDFAGFLSEYQRGMRARHAESFALHEAFLATSILHGGVTANGGMPTLVPAIYAGVDVNDLVPAPYVMRIFGGHFVPLVNNAFTTLNFPSGRYVPSEWWGTLKALGVLPPDYDITPAEALEAENALGAIYDGGAPFYGEMFNNEAYGYRTLAEADQVPPAMANGSPGSIFDAFAHMGQRTLPELTSLRRQCSGAFNGRWHPPVPILANAPTHKVVYLFNDFSRLNVPEGYHRARIPTLINAVRQYADAEGNWTDHIAIVLYNWGMASDSLVNYQIDFERYGLATGRTYRLTIHTTKGSVWLGNYTGSFNITLPVEKSRMGCMELTPVDL